MTLPRRLAAVLAVLGVLGLTLLPQAHVHARAADDDHHHDVLHRHFEPHRHAESAAQIDHAEEPALWIDMAATGPEPPIGVHGTGPFLRAPGASTEAPVGRCPAADALQARGHDPPWAESHALRGPPPPASSDLS